MHLHKNLKRFSGFFLSLLLLTFSSSAREERFQICTEKYQTAEEGEVTRYFLITETTKFFFQPPYKWKSGADVEHQTVTFLAPDQSVAVKMQIGTSVSCENLTELRNQIQSRYPKGAITAQSVCYTAGGVAAPTFDIEWSNAKKVPITTRLIFVPSSKGTIEFSLSTGSDRFDPNCWAINRIAGSFRTELLSAKDYAKE